MADEITGLTDDDITTEWPTETASTQTDDDDATDPGGFDEADDADQADDSDAEDDTSGSDTDQSDT